MIRKLTALALAACLMGGAAAAAQLNFLAEGNTYERGELSGYVLNNANTGGLAVTLTSNFNPYFDAGNAGLGVCKVLTSSKQCDPSNDDNVTGSTPGFADEWVQLGFETAVNIKDLVFRGTNHALLTLSLKTLLIDVNGMGLQNYSFADASTALFENVRTIRFQYGGTNPNQFYVTGGYATPVPVPASLPLLAAGIGAVAWIARRRKAA